VILQARKDAQTILKGVSLRVNHLEFEFRLNDQSKPGKSCAACNVNRVFDTLVDTMV
jgi:hypothetical protein